MLRLLLPLLLKLRSPPFSVREAARSGAQEIEAPCQPRHREGGKVERERQRARSNAPERFQLSLCIIPFVLLLLLLLLSLPLAPLFGLHGVATKDDRGGEERAGEFWGADPSGSELQLRCPGSHPLFFTPSPTASQTSNSSAESSQCLPQSVHRH